MVKLTMMVTGGLASRHGENEHEVHAKGCVHIRKLELEGAHGWDVEADTVKAAIADEVADYEANDQDWGVDDFKVLPCARKAEAAARFKKVDA